MRYRFDDFELDSERYELRQDGAVRHVEPLVFDLVLFFVRQSGRVVGRDEIIGQVWQGRAISDATISSCIKAARRALGDNGDSQAYIRTVRGRGFEFTARVTTGADVPPPVEPARIPHGERGDASPRPVLAVLPFTNLSAEVDEYFADGLTEDIITNLCRFRDLRMIAGASTFHFKGRAVDLPELRERLNASYV